jgi:hypothetical protein
VQLKVGGKFHLKLNISKRPIANKYREGKMKRTLKRECKGLEIAKREAAAGSIGGTLWVLLVSASVGWCGISALGRYTGPASAGAPVLKPRVCAALPTEV